LYPGSVLDLEVKLRKEFAPACLALIELFSGYKPL
jgi:hypothetical protein